MIDLEPVKKVLRFSPTLYRNAYTLFRATPFGKRRMAEIDQTSSKLLQLRLEEESGLISKYLNGDWTVRHGPFAGMKYAPITSGSVLSPYAVGFSLKSKTSNVFAYDIDKRARENLVALAEVEWHSGQSSYTRALYKRGIAARNYKEHTDFL